MIRRRVPSRARVVVAAVASVGVALAVVMVSPSDVRAANDDQYAAVTAWLNDHGADTVVSVLSADPEWVRELNLKKSSQVTFDAAHRLWVLGVPDYDLRGKRVRGTTSPADQLSATREYCAAVIVDTTVSDTLICVESTRGSIELTGLRQAGLITDITALESDATLVDDGPYGLFVYGNGKFEPINDTAEFHAPDGAEPREFITARAKRAAEHRAAALVDGPVLGAGPSLLRPDADEATAWAELVDRGLARESPEADARFPALSWTFVAVLLTVGAAVGVGVLASRRGRARGVRR